MSIVVDPEESTVDNTTDQKTQNLELELEDAKEDAKEVVKEDVKKEEDESEFRGMNFEKLQDSYSHLERRMSQQGQELGELRQLSDTLIQKQPKEEIDFFDKPIEAVNQAIDGNERLNAIEKQSEKLAERYAQSELMRRHPDYLDIDKSPEFSKWIGSSRSRKMLYAEASKNLDVEIADELMDDYKKSKSVQTLEEGKLDGEREDTLKQVKSDAGSTGGTTTKKIFRRADLMNLQINDPTRYDDMQDEILLAYAEGRVR